MTKRTFVIGTDKFQFTLDKQDKTNTDEVELILTPDTTIAINDEVELQLENTTVFFLGLVQEIQDGNGRKVVKVWDYGSQLLQRTVNTIYTNQSPEAIIEDIISNYSSMTYVSTISSGITLSNYVVNKKRAFDVVTELSEILLANFYVDPSKNFQLELEGQNTITNLDIDSSTAILDGRWKSDATQIINSVTVDGDDRQRFERDPELFSGDGSTTEFTLAEVPDTIKVEHPVGTIKTGYTPTVSTGDYYIERSNKKVIFDTAPSSGSNNIQITYTVSMPVSVLRRNAESITAYGQRDKTFKKSYITTRTEARQYAEYIIDRYKDPVETATYVLPTSSTNNINDYLPNSYIAVSDTQNSKSGFYIIRKVNWEHPGRFRITIGTPTEDIIFWQKEIQSKVKQLEETDDNSTILNVDEFIEENITMQWDIDVFSIDRREYDSDTFYLADTSITRNQMLEDGSGPIMRDVADGNGYTNVNVYTRGVDNTDGIVTTYSQELGRDNLLDDLVATITHIGIGDNNTTPLVTDTTLGNETIRESSFDIVQKVGSSVVCSIFLDVSENNGNDIEEMGTFDASSGGNIYTRSLTNITSKTASIEFYGEINISVNIENDTTLN